MHILENTFWAEDNSLDIEEIENAFEEFPPEQVFSIMTQEQRDLFADYYEASIDFAGNSETNLSAADQPLYEAIIDTRESSTEISKLQNEQPNKTLNKSYHQMQHLENQMDLITEKSDYFGTEGYYSHPQYEIYDVRFYGGNMHFKINTENWQLGGVFRVYEPKSGSEMTLIGCDPDYSNYRQRSEIIEHWNSIEMQCRNASIEKYKELSGHDFIFSNEEKITQSDILENRIEAEISHLTLDEYLAQRGLASPVDDFMIDKLKLPHGQSKYDERSMHENAKKSSQEYHNKRNAAIQEYNDKVAVGEIVEPTNVERYIKAAQGHTDNASTQAAQRVLEKRGYIQDDNGNWIENTTKTISNESPIHNTPQNAVETKSLTKEEFDKLTAEIKDIAKTYQSDPNLLIDYLAFKSQFYQYSPTNTLLIHLQNPHATFVGSFTFWKNKGYGIKKGQHHIKISRPIETSKFPKEINGKTVWTDIKYASTEEKAKIAQGELEIKKTTRFIPHQVFDISQTTCPVEDYPKFYNMGHPDMEQHQLYECIKQYAKESGFTVIEEDLSSISLHGYYSKTDDSIHINSLLEDSKRLETMCHELAHGVLHKTSTQPVEILEFEAECFGTMLKRKMGYPVSEESKRYINQYFTKSNLLKNSKFDVDKTLNRLSKTFNHVSKGIETTMSNMGFAPEKEIAQNLSQAKNNAINPLKISENFMQALS